MATNLRAWVDLIRFHEYGPLAIMCGVVGALLATRDIDYRLIQLLIFITSSSISAFILNDLTDVEEDRLKGRCRNPIATGRLSVKAARNAFLITALTSIITLLALNIYVIAVGLLILSLYWSYSYGIRLKDKPPADLIIHGAIPALYIIAGYVTYRPLSTGAVLLSAMAFTLSCMSELLQELRDLNADTLRRKTTLAVIGVKGGVNASITLMILSITLYIVLTVINVIPIYFIAFTPLSYLLLSPLIKLKVGVVGVEDVINQLRLRGSLIALVIIATYVLLSYVLNVV